jgi:hypothetical protein
MHTTHASELNVLEIVCFLGFFEEQIIWKLHVRKFQDNVNMHNGEDILSLCLTVTVPVSDGSSKTLEQMVRYARKMLCKFYL